MARRPLDPTKCKNCDELVEWVKGSGWNHVGRGALCRNPLEGDVDRMLMGQPAELKATWAEPVEGKF